MYLVLIIFILNVLTISVQGKEILKHIKKYDLVDCIVLTPSRNKRSTIVDSESMKPAFDAEVRFKYFQTDFHLILMEDIDFQNLKVESYSTNSIKFEDIQTKMYEGVVKDEFFPSYVIGYLQKHVFVGSVNWNNNIYFVESARNYFPNLISDSKIIVYKEEDIEIFGDVIQKGIISDIFSSLFRKKNYTEANEFLPKGINKTKNANEEYACRIEIVSDHTLYEYFQRNVNSLTAYLYLHGKYADFIFRRTDFDGDGERDRIRIIPERIFIYKSVNDPDYPMANTPSMVTFLKQFSFRIQNYCLSLCMSYRHASNSVIGEAFKSNDTPSGPPGGICQKPILVPSEFGSYNRSLNTAVVTIKDSKGATLPLAASLLAVAHEFGHSFGSHHDNLDDLYCSPGGTNGFYLMHYKSQMKIKPLSSFFSPCSKKNIAVVISARGDCLQPHFATCGNGVQEGDEDCDCGKEVTCQYLDKCCTPSDVQPPEKGCAFRKSKASACSPRENKCCHNKCTINNDTKFLCYKDATACLVSYCDGKNATCPKPKVAPDTYPCQSTSKSCSGGVCNSSVCLDNGLKDCICKNTRFECKICCLKSNHCVTASSLKLFTSAGEQYFSLEGSLCYSKRYRCDGSGNCVDPNLRVIDSTGKTNTVLWPAVGGLTFALLVLLSVFCYFVKKTYWDR